MRGSACRRASLLLLLHGAALTYTTVSDSNPLQSQPPPPPPPPPLPPLVAGNVSGVAVAVGRLQNCAVCERPSLGSSSCVEHSGSTRTTVAGQYGFKASGSHAHALLMPSPDCTDFLTGVKVIAPLRCGTYVCTLITDLHAALSAEPHGLSSYRASSTLSHAFIGLAATDFVDVSTFDPTVAPPVAGHGGNAAVMMGIAMRWADAWEWLACSCIHAAERRRRANPEFDKRFDQREHLPSTNGTDNEAEKRRTPAHTVRWLASDVDAKLGDAAVAGSHAVAVSTFMRRRLADLLARGRDLTSAAALTGAGASEVAKLFSNATLDAAASVGVTSLKAADVAEPAAAFAAFVGAASVNTHADLSRTGESGRSGPRLMAFDEWRSAQSSLAITSFLSRRLAQKTSDLILGHMTTGAYRSEHSRPSILQLLQETPENRATADGDDIRIACLDPASDTYSPEAELHQQSQCLYANNEAEHELLAMNSLEWAYFMLCCVTASWLVMTVVVSFVATVYVLPGVRARNAEPIEDDRWPHIAVLVPCYMPNEQTIIEETLESICSDCSYKGIMDVHVPYNTPKPLGEIEDRLAKTTTLYGHALRCERVEGSTSKAHNLEYALNHMVGDASITIIFDADHHPRRDTIEHLVRTLVHSPQFAMAQGAVLVERGGYPVLRWLVDGMEWTSWHFWGPGLSILVGSAYFGGGNAAWRTDVLQELGFDTSMLTEDIDVSIRALSLGHRMQVVPWAQVGELCPATLVAFYKQRLRWAMGWEQVTSKRFATLFSSNLISESKKWRTSVLLVSRYWAILGVLNAVGTSLASFYLKLTFGVRLGRPLPIEVASSVNFYAGLFALAFTFVSLGLFREPWWRWVHVVMFIPFGMPYLLLTCVLIIISWITLSCFFKDLEWVPTARHAGAETHSIKMDASSGEYNTFATMSAKPMTNAPQASDEARGLLAPGPT